MKQSEAKQKIEVFFRRLGNEATFFDEKKFVQARIGEALVGFEYDEREEILLVQALIYRFRSKPRDKVLDAIFAEENETNDGYGSTSPEDESRSLYPYSACTEKIGEQHL